MSDEQLLTKYRRYKRKKLCIILLVIIISFFLILTIYKKIFFQKREIIIQPEVIEDNKIIDSSPPKIYLKSNKIEINQGDELSYYDYIDKIIDNIDTNLMESVQYTTIDSSKIGEQYVIFSVVDSSNNLAQESLLVVVKQKQQEEIKQEEKDFNIQQKNITTTKKVEENPKLEENKTTEIKKEKIIKYFLFKDGYTMMNVAEVCSNELKNLNRKGMCSPIQDENGIYLGMKLETD